jgi:predicted nucleic acid-binding protein
MSGFLLDTNVLSEFNRRGDPDRRVKLWLEGADTDSLYVSVLTFPTQPYHRVTQCERLCGCRDGCG